MSARALSPYERTVIEDIAVAAEDPYRTPFAVLVHASRSAAATGTTRRSDGDRGASASVGKLLGDVTAGLSRVVARTVRSDLGVRALRASGVRRVHDRGDIARLDLWEIDEASASVRPKYVALGALLGAVTGLFGVRGLAADAGVVAALSLRAVNEYAVRYGFDVSSPDEQAFATHVFATALAPRAALPAAQPSEALADVAEAVSGLSAVAGILRGVAKLGRRVLKSRAARVVPVMGAIVGAALNAWTLAGVVRTAERAYQERFLARKHGRGEVRRLLPPSNAPSGSAA